MNNTITTRSLKRIITLSSMAVALQGTSVLAQTALTDLVTVPPVPSNIQVPPGHRAFLKGYAVGTQNYICLPSGWTFLGPQATLFAVYQWNNVEVRQQITTHFLSMNPMEVGMARPTWQGSFDTSAVWGRLSAASNDPAFVAPGAIPWLLLEAAGTQRGPTGGSLLSQTTYIHRVKTSGGVMPTGVCTLGSTAFVPYTADYFFYKADR